MLNRIRRCLHVWPHRGTGDALPVIDPYDGAQQLAHQCRIRRSLAEIRAEATASH